MSVRHWSFLEQAIVSAANFIVLIVLARELSPYEWGVFSMGYAMMLFAQGFQRAFVILPFVTMTQADNGALRGFEFWNELQWRICTISIVVSSLVGLLFFVFNLTWLAFASWVAALLTLSNFYHEFVRRLFLQNEKLKQCIQFSVMYASMLLLGTLIATYENLSALLTASLVAVCTAFVALIVLFHLRRLAASVPQIRLERKIVLKYGMWAALGHFAYGGYTTSVQMLLGLISGPSAVALFAAIRNFIQPTNVLIGAVDNLDKPKAARAFGENGLDGLNGVMKGSMSRLLMIGTTYLVIVAFVGEWLIEWVYEGKYSEQTGELYFWLLVACVMLVAQPLETGLYVIQKPALIFYNRCVAALIGLLCAIVLIPKLAVIGAIFSILCGWLTSAILAAWQLSRQKKLAVDGVSSYGN